jgi:hypothetical protein
MILPGKNTGLILKILIPVTVTFTVLLFIESRGHPFKYFSTTCIDYRQKEYSRKLNDRIVDYLAEARLRGVAPSDNDSEFRKKISDGKLVKVRSGRRYVVDRLRFSYPALTPESRDLLDEIAERFREKASAKGLNDARFYLTSLTRKTEHLRALRRNNVNSSANSPHLYGSAFDISYKRFSVRKMYLTNCDMKFLKEALAEVIFELRRENKCWATYERMQNCFHVVAR